MIKFICFFTMNEQKSILLFVNGKTGVIIESKTVEAVVAAVVSLKDNYQLMKLVGLNAMRYISVNYACGRYADEVVKIYKSVL